MASAECNCWQTEIWSSNDAVPTVIYSSSVEALETAVRNWLTMHQPETFANASTKHEAPEQVRRYLYSDGSRQIPILSIYDANATQTLAPGWYYCRGVELYPHPHPLPNFEATVDHFVEQAMLVSPGPDYLQAVSRDKQSLLTRIVTNPTIPAMLVGMVAFLCFIVMSAQGSTSTFLEQSSLLVLLLSLLMVAFVSGLIGLAVLGIINTMKSVLRRE